MMETSGIVAGAQPIRHFKVSTERICHLHLPWCAAFDLEQLRRADDDRYAFRTRRCDIKAVEAVQELHSPRRVRMARRRR